MRTIPNYTTLLRVIAVACLLGSSLLGAGRIANAQTLVPAAPVVFVNPTGPPASQSGLQVQWTVPGGVVTFAVVRNGREPNDPLFKSWGPLPGGQRDQLDTDVKPGQQYEYQVCAAYSGPLYLCSGWVAATAPSAPVAGRGTPAIVSHEVFQTAITVHWETAPPTYYNKFHIRYAATSTTGQPKLPYLYEEVNVGGRSGTRQIQNLETNTTYVFAVEGYDAQNAVWLGWGPDYRATTSPATNIGERPAPVIVATEEGTTWILIAWDVPYKNRATAGKYAKFIISYRLKPAPNEPPTTEMKEVADGLVSNHTLNDLKPGSTYIISVQGCNFNLGLNGRPGEDCAESSPTVEATTKTPTTGLGSIVPALLSVSEPTVTRGNTVKVVGSVFTTSGPVTLSLVGSKSTVDLGTATVSGGGFSKTVTIPADTAPGSYKIRAQIGAIRAETSIEVIAPSSKGTLTVTAGGTVYTAIDLDNAFTLSGTNFTPGSVTIFVDSSSGPQISTATVAGNGTFRTEVTVKSSLGNAVRGAHKIVAVQNGAVVGELSVTFFKPDVIH